ncbi:hypothetical protein SAMN05216242_12244 [Thauera chlorobenzoica]|nr:hypothetical protein SAMN05216242_12244 [Thauera chlorobenzoica]
MGVFPPSRYLPVRSSCLPHVRGGVSLPGRTMSNKNRSSPRPWGCFRGDYRGPCPSGVFPTSVGVFPGCWIVIEPQGGLPHVRGGVSPSPALSPAMALSSPRPWGCFRHAHATAPCAVVFPTSVGVFPTCARHGTMRRSLPHVRGGVSAF